MAKEVGLGDNFYLSGYNISGDINSFSRIGGGPAALDVTDITQLAFERRGGLRTGEISGSTWLNPSANRAHPRLGSLPRADQLASYYHLAGTIGNPAANLWSVQLNYDGNRSNDGNLPIDFQTLSDGFGLEWGVQLTPGVRTDTGATNGASLDTATSLAFGAQAYLHVFAVTGTSVTVAVQDSADNVSFANITGLAFTAVVGGAVGFERLATGNTATIRRYLRVATTGTFSNAQFAVSVTKNEIAGQAF